MTLRNGSGWQYVLADLSLILFMVTAAALAQAQDVAPRLRSDPPAQDQPLSPRTAALAVYRVAPGAPDLKQWLQAQSADARQQLTIVAQYQPGGQDEALNKAQTLAQDAGEAGLQARIVIEPGKDGTAASLAFDTPALSAKD